MTESQTGESTPKIDAYLRERIAPRFREMVRAAEQRVAAAQRELDDLRGATATLAWEIAGAAPVACYLNIANGEMTVAEQPAAEPLMTVSQSDADWARFATGMSGFLGGDRRRPLGRARIDRLRTVKGAVRFVLTGLPDGGAWTCTMYFGSGPRPREPQTTVTLTADIVGKIQAGQLDPQAAFMQGQVRIAGDMGLAMQLGMAMFM